MDVKPKKAEVYIDGRYVGRAREFDGYPDYLWLDAGTHQVEFYREGFGTVTREYTVHAGELIAVDFRMQPGESVAPQGSEG